MTLDIITCIRKPLRQEECFGPKVPLPSSEKHAYITLVSMPLCSIRSIGIEE